MSTISTLSVDVPAVPDFDRCSDLKACVPQRNLCEVSQQFPTSIGAQTLSGAAIVRPTTVPAVPDFDRCSDGSTAPC